MERLADTLTRYIIRKKAIGEEDYEAYRYGMLTCLEMTLCMAVCFMIAIQLKSFFECLVLLTLFFLLRSYVGGIHLKHYVACFFCSCLVITLILLAARYLGPPDYLSWAVSQITMIGIYGLAPLATKHQVTDKEEEEYFEKQRKRILLGIAVVTILFWVFGMSEYLAIIMYATIAILISMILGIIKTEWIKRKR